jgi:hypothetical protein
MNAPNVPYRLRGPAPAFAPIGRAPRALFACVIAAMTLGMTSGIGTIVFAAATGRADRHGDPTIGIGIVLVYLSILLIYVQVGVAVWWVHKVWSWLPPEQRWSRHWKSWITPNAAAFMLLIPYFHYYWMFVVNCGMCDAFDRLRVSYATPRPAPKSLAIACGVLQIVVPFLPLAGIMWLVLMSRVERMMRDMAASNAQPMPLGV